MNIINLTLTVVVVVAGLTVITCLGVLVGRWINDGQQDELLSGYEEESIQDVLGKQYRDAR